MTYGIGPGKYTVLAVYQIVHCASGLLFLTAVCLIRQRFLKILYHSDLGIKPLPILLFGSGLVFLLCSSLPVSSSSGLTVYLRSGLPFVVMGTFRETHAEGDEGSLHLGLKRPCVYSDLSPEEKESLINHYVDAKDIWDNVKMPIEGFELMKVDWESQLYDDFEHFHQNKGKTIHTYYVWFAKLINNLRNIKMTMYKMKLNSKFVNNMLPEWGRFVTAMKLNKGLSYSNYDQLVDIIEDMGTMQRKQVQLVMGELITELGMQIQVKVTLDEEQLLFTEGGQDNVVDDDVDEQPAPTAHTMFMANISFVDPVYDEASPSYDSDIQSEVHDHDNYEDAICDLHDVHEKRDNVQPNCVVVSDAEYTSDSHMIPYDQCVKDNA
uniref:Zinc finger, CCHC-type n=1 Tax=Tanacetum cinerariifolium TaxID=118510 RepID=A0A6L2MJV5_TANCI|nr:hypothetical protein [Tanacetum cinerariifolium]